MKTDREEAFCSAYWDWMRRVRTEEPDPSDFGLQDCCGETLARQCRCEFDKGKLTQARRITQIRKLLSAA